MEKSNWEKMYDKKYGKECIEHCEICEEVKDFIRNILKKQKKEIFKKLTLYPRGKTKGNQVYAWGWNKACVVLSELKIRLFK